MYRYTVRCEFTSGSSRTVEAWLTWLRNLHLSDVLRSGASSAEIVEMSGEHPVYEIRYQFPCRADFEKYLNEFAPALRQEGLSLFPPDQLGMKYSRTDGFVIHSTTR